MNNKKLIGITGLAGSGKSSVSDIIRKEGYPVIDLDKVGHSILNDSNIQLIIKSEFGDNILEYSFNGRYIINRKKLGNIVFNDISKLKVLNGIMWPLMRDKIIEIRNRLFKKLDLVFLDGAIIFQAGFDDLCDKIIWIDCEDKIRLKRLAMRIGFERAEKIISSQQNMFLFKDKADLYIDNNLNEKSLEENVLLIIADIKNTGLLPSQE